MLKGVSCNTTIRFLQERYEQLLKGCLAIRDITLKYLQERYQQLRKECLAIRDNTFPSTKVRTAAQGVSCNTWPIRSITSKKGTNSCWRGSVLRYVAIPSLRHGQQRVPKGVSCTQVLQAVCFHQDAVDRPRRWADLIVASVTNRSLY